MLYKNLKEKLRMNEDAVKHLFRARDELDAAYVLQTEMVEWFNINVAMHVLSTEPTNTKKIESFAEKQEAISQLVKGFNTNKITFDDNLSLVNFTKQGSLENADDKAYFLATFQQCERIAEAIDELIMETANAYGYFAGSLIFSKTAST